MFTLILALSIIFTKDDEVQMVLSLITPIGMIFDLILIGAILQKV